MASEVEQGRADNIRRVAVFFVLLGFWLIFSGHFDTFHISLGVVCAALVSFFSYDLFFPALSSSRKLLKAWRFLQYIPWLLYQVLLANLHVVYLVLFPDEIRPQLIRFKTTLTSDLAKVTLGNSITLTPGTMTMDIADSEFSVHALSDKVAKDLLSGEMERRVAHVFLEPAPTGRRSEAS